LLEAVDATRELWHLARQGAADVERLGKLTVPKGHRGDVAENDWIAAMMSIYKKITGEDPRTSVGGPLGKDEGVRSRPPHSLLEGRRETDRHQVLGRWLAEPDPRRAKGRPPLKIRFDLAI